MQNDAPSKLDSPGSPQPVIDSSPFGTHGARQALHRLGLREVPPVMGMERDSAVLVMATVRISGRGQPTMAAITGDSAVNNTSPLTWP